MNRTKCLKIFGLSEGYSEDDLKAAYRRLAKKYHPDIDRRPNATENFQNLRLIFDYLLENRTGRRSSGKTVERWVEFDVSRPLWKRMGDAFLPNLRKKKRLTVIVRPEDTSPEMTVIYVILKTSAMSTATYTIKIGRNEWVETAYRPIRLEGRKYEEVYFRVIFDK